MLFLETIKKTKKLTKAEMESGKSCQSGRRFKIGVYVVRRKRNRRWKSKGETLQRSQVPLGKQRTQTRKKEARQGTSGFPTWPIKEGNGYTITRGTFEQRQTKQLPGLDMCCRWGGTDVCAGWFDYFPVNYILRTQYERELYILAIYKDMWTFITVILTNHCGHIHS